MKKIIKGFTPTPKFLVRGLSLVEILVVITVFAFIGILSTRSLFLTIRGAKKSDSLIRVRENVNYAMGVIERQIRNAESINCLDSTSLVLSYTALEGVESTFSCEGDYIASGSGRLTAEDITVTECLFSCWQNDINTPPVVSINIVAEDSISSSIEKGSVTSQTEITARNY